jgi:hypothetical protein
MEITFENTKKETAVSSLLKMKPKKLAEQPILFPQRIIFNSFLRDGLPKFEGQGFGKKLVEESIKFARENQWKINPHCSYARSVMMRMQGIEDVFSK